ncbi:MAG: hypothetical protein PVF58_14125 [Candidatus Methanofastidiosia archaeon]|jgi:hypothetical protein
MNKDEIGVILQICTDVLFSLDNEITDVEFIVKKKGNEMVFKRGENYGGW